MNGVGVGHRLAQTVHPHLPMVGSVSTTGNVKAGGEIRGEEVEEETDASSPRSAYY